MWQQVLSGELLAQREIVSHTGILRVGGTSVLIIELQGSHQRFSWAPSVHELFQSSTLGTMVSVFGRAAGDSSHADASESDSMYCEAEATLLPSTTYGENKEQRKDGGTDESDAVDASPGGGGGESC